MMIIIIIISIITTTTTIFLTRDILYLPYLVSPTSNSGALYHLVAT